MKKIDIKFLEDNNLFYTFIKNFKLQSTVHTYRTNCTKSSTGLPKETCSCSKCCPSAGVCSRSKKTSWL